MLLNVQQITITNSQNMTSTVFNTIGENCPRVEVITYIKSSYLSVFSSFVRNYQNAKDICLDNSIFFCAGHDMELKVCDLERYPAKYIFRKWDSKVLERLSIKNVQLEFDYHMLPQKTVAKFVRNALTSLRWFRSDLSKKKKMVRIT